MAVNEKLSNRYIFVLSSFISSYKLNLVGKRTTQVYRFEIALSRLFGRQGNGKYGDKGFRTSENGRNKDVTS